MNDSRDKPQHEEPMRLRDTLQSVLAAALGVQSNRARERDFSKGKPSHFIALGVAFTLLFVMVVLGVVKLVLYLAGV
ncbi:DUF2970 domain-containing protein [Halopseudomonas aestusnigri]|jgi:hypothetical protein|uniref:DUF2970 domain-containing protein n=1 Tax=Halopseudomonas TaxID=2901189 RepID=UPI000C495AAA|nr:MULTISPECIES: DUF2970 domain-containing protein [Halopseudomonas]MAD26618.1 hypothetical protein [Pseudomonadales bacterium]MEE2799582.1 DUF2970 domain-containing protein [Pseudomonadota bacterium]MAG99538.1 hypothetical protein [Pseudomonadales bacterium]MAK75078.1 hypothetical protein [Pseudomonadales bacterium]MAP77858.1 hypothetical protein [Pseudomonadales bacterium]|tara:strand:- start:267 stop:497 length:231 start_codon:yes stop_codon:yes gene_type:complete